MEMKWRLLSRHEMKCDGQEVEWNFVGFFYRAPRL